ncbi:MAG: thioredoxin-related protein [Parasphingorhabdus sp.]|jgi:thioredoxin-related protein
MIKQIVCTIIYSLMLMVSLAHGEELRNASAFFDNSFGDLSEEADTARAEGKTGILIMFEEDDCPWCRRMKERVLNRASVQDYFHKNFRILTINVEGGTMIVNFDGTEIKEKEFAQKHNRVRATPVFAFFNTDGEFLTRFTGTSKTVEEFLWLGEFVVTGEYQNGRFSTYKRARLKNSAG